MARDLLEVRGPAASKTSAWPLALGLAAVWLTIVLVEGWTRSAWGDEMFSGFVTDPAMSWQDHLPAWKAEPHPPTYYAMLWAYRHMVGDGHSIFALRSFSIGFSAILAFGALAYWRASKWPGLAVFAFFLFTAPAMEFFPQETRSYFLTVFGGVYAALYFLRAFEFEKPDRPQLRDVIVGCVAAALLGVHLISIAFGGLLFAMATVAMIAQKRWAWLSTTILIGVFIFGPALVLIVTTIFGALSSAMGNFWITRRNLVLTLYALPFAIGAPIVLTLAYTFWRRRDLRDRREFIAAGLVLAVMGSMFILGCISLIKPMLVIRYLTAPMAALVPPCAVLITGLVPRAAKPLGRAGVALLVLVSATAFALGRSYGDLNPNSEWAIPAQALNAAPGCAGAEIPYLVLNYDPDPDPEALWHRSFEWYAPNHVFVAATAAAQQKAAHQACPVKLWVADRMTWMIPNLGEYKAAERRACANGSMIALRFVSGFLVVDSKDQATIAAWKGPKVSCEAMLQSD